MTNSDEFPDADIELATLQIERGVSKATASMTRNAVTIAIGGLYIGFVVGIHVGYDFPGEYPLTTLSWLAVPAVAVCMVALLWSHRKLAKHLGELAVISSRTTMDINHKLAEVLKNKPK